MADEKLVDQDPAGALTGAELVYGVQGSADVKMTTGDMSRVGLEIVSVTASRAFTIGDAGRMLVVDSATDVQMTVPTNATTAFPVGTVIFLFGKGAGAVTLVAAGGVTLSAAALSFTQNKSAAITKIATDAWVVVGALT